MSFQVAFLQFNPQRKNPGANIQSINNWVGNVHIDLLVLPELANSGYLYEKSADLLPFAEPNDGSGEFLSALTQLSRKTGGLIITGYAEAYQDQLYNSAAAVSPDGVIHNYRKIHLYADEKSLFRPGDAGFSIVEWQGVKLGIMVCFDWFFPESARSLALLGAQIIAHPANLVLPYCQDAMITRSIENKVFTITANRIGLEKLGEKELQFTGQSQMTTPTGEVIFRGPVDEPILHLASIKPEEALDKSVSPVNDLFADRRSSKYHLSSM